MYMMVVQMSTDPSRAEQVARHLREDVVEFAKQQPGFVSGQWLRSTDGSEGMGVVVFASEEAAATTRAPIARPSSTAERPTPPPAPSTNSVSPGFRYPRSLSA